MIILLRRAYTVGPPATSAPVASVLCSESGHDANDWPDSNDEVFIAAHESFYIAPVSETGRPFVHFRGALESFLQMLHQRLLDYADFQGSKQYMTSGNVIGNDRMSLFLMDYAHRQRLKILGHRKVSNAKEDPEILAQLAVKDYQARGERAVTITIVAFDRNWPQSITPRLAQDELVERFAPIRQEMAKPRAENRPLRRQAACSQRSSRAPQARGR